MSYSSTDETDDEQMEEVLRLRRVLRAQLERKRKKKERALQIVAKTSGDQHRISSSSEKEEQKHPTNLKKHLIKFSKQQNCEPKIKAKQKNKIRKEKHKEQQKIGYCTVYKFGVYADRTKENEKFRDVTQERHRQPKETNTIDYNKHLRKPSRKKSKGLDKNGNILKQVQYKNIPETSETLVPSKTQPLLDIENIVQECADEFKCSIKNAILKFVPECYALTNEDSSSKSQGSASKISNEMSASYKKCSKNNDKTIRKTHTRTQMADDSESQEKNNFKKLVKQEIYQNLLKMQMDEQHESLTNEADVSYKENKKSVGTEHIKVRKELECKRQGMGKTNLEEASVDRVVEHKAFKQKEKLVTILNSTELETKKKCSSRNLKHTRRKEETFAADAKTKNDSESEFVEIDTHIELEHNVDKYLSSLPQYYEYKTMVRVPKDGPKDVSTSDPRLEYSEISGALLDDESSSENLEEGEILESQSVIVISSSTENSPDSKTTENLNAEESLLEKSNLSAFDINEYFSIVRQKYERAKERRMEKDRNHQTLQKGRKYETLEKERLKCQGRIEKELELIEKLARKQCSNSPYTISSESSDDEVFEKSKITTKVPKLKRNKTLKDKLATAISQQAVKRRHEMSKPPSPILVYHYYKPVSQQLGKKATNSDLKDITNIGSEPSTSHMATITRKKIGPRTLPPLDSSSSSDEMSERISVGGKSSRSSGELSSESEIREPVLKQPRREETLKTVCKNTRKLETKTSDRKFKIQYEPIVITRSFDTRSITKSKRVPG